MLYFPHHIYIETSDSYNHRGHDHTTLHSQAKHLLDIELYQSLLYDLKEIHLHHDHAMKISLHWSDEPLHNPNFFTYAELGRRIFPEARWLLRTNGALLTAGLVERIKPLFHAVVIDCSSESIRDAFWREELDLVTARFPRRIQAPEQLSRSRGYAERTAEAIFHTNEKYRVASRVQSNDATQTTKRCMRLWAQMAISYGGQVFLCCRDNDRVHPVGDLRQQSLWDAYNSPEARLLRHNMELGQRGDIDMCAMCPGAYPHAFRALSPTSGAIEHSDDAQAGLRDAQWATALADALAVRRELADGEAASQMPFGAYDYEAARTLAKALGHIALPGYLPRRYEYVVGLTRTMAEAILVQIQEALGPALKGVWICGSRVITRTRLLDLDPSVFDDPVQPKKGALKIGGKGHVREFGPNPQYSSDMDIKVLANEDAISDEDASLLGYELGAAMEVLSPFVPLSGHRKPFIRIIRVPASCANTRAAFDHYNANRMELLAKGPISLEHTLLLFDPASPNGGLFADPTAAVVERLSPPTDREKVPLVALIPALSESWCLKTRAEKWRATHQELSIHQLIFALRDFPALEPDGVSLAKTTSGTWDIEAGEGAIWAAQQAGRTHIAAKVRLA